MTEKISLNLTLEELEIIDKYIELNDDTRQLFDKIQKAYPKSPVETAYKRVYGEYPPTTPSVDNHIDIRWSAFQGGYYVGYEDGVENSNDFAIPKVEETAQEPEDNEWTIEKLQEKNWYVDTKTNLKSHWEPKPKTPEQTEKSLKEAFVKAQQTEEWKETQRKIDAPKESWMNKPMNELVEILNKNPPDCLKFQMGKTLEDRIYKWWTTCFTTKCEWSMEECLDDLLDIIELFLPREQSHEGTQNVNTIFAVEAHNELLQKIKSKLRNKKI